MRCVEKVWVETRLFVEVKEVGAQEMFRVNGRLKAASQFTCPMCVSGGHKDAVQENEALLGDAGSHGGWSVWLRVRCAGRKFRELSPILTLRG